MISNDNESEFKPDVALHPGHILKTAMKRDGITMKELCRRSGFKRQHWESIIRGIKPIGFYEAGALTSIFGGAMTFWINLEKNYQETRKRLSDAG